MVDLHPFYLALGSKEEEQQQAYIDYVSGTVPDYEVKLIYEALQRGQVTGGDRFREELARKLWCSFVQPSFKKWENTYCVHRPHTAFFMWRKNGFYPSSALLYSN